MAEGGRVSGSDCRAAGVPSGTASALLEGVLGAERSRSSPSCVQAPVAISAAAAEAPTPAMTPPKGQMAPCKHTKLKAHGRTLSDKHLQGVIALIQRISASFLQGLKGQEHHLGCGCMRQGHRRAGAAAPQQLP